MRKPRISRTATLRMDISNILRRMLGRRVKLGQSYPVSVKSRQEPAPSLYTAISYDEDRRLLLLKMSGHDKYIVTDGDVVVWRGVLYAENTYCRFTLAKPIHVTVQCYMKKKGLEHVTDAVIADAIKWRYPKLPIHGLRFDG